MKSEKVSRYYGVNFRKARCRFLAKTIINEKTINIGGFIEEIEAAIAYDNFVRENNLDRRLNFPDPEPENLIPNTRLVRLTRGMFAIVDEEDFERVNQYMWHVKRDKNNYYAVRSSSPTKNIESISLHNFIKNDRGMVDHINGNGLDDRKINLRFCTNMENLQNSKPMRGKSSKYKGVSLFTRYGKFAAQIRVNGVPMVIGYYDDETDAARAYDNKAKDVFKEFARLNFPDE